MAAVEQQQHHPATPPPRRRQQRTEVQGQSDVVVVVFISLFFSRCLQNVEGFLRKWILKYTEKKTKKKRFFAFVF